MSKSLYSVVLTDEVVHQIDRMALEQNTNRSNIINQILAEYVSYTTPEMRISQIFKTIEEAILGSGAELIPSVTPHQSTMHLKSSLNVRYRPTVRYEVALYRAVRDNCMGQLSVLYRTQSGELSAAMERFFRLWVSLESEFAPDTAVQYALGEGRFVRTLRFCEGDAAQMISDYIRLFDDALKGAIGGTYTEGDLRELVRFHSRKGNKI